MQLQQTWRSTNLFQFFDWYNHYHRLWNFWYKWKRQNHDPTNSNDEFTTLSKEFSSTHKNWFALERDGIYFSTGQISSDTAKANGAVETFNNDFKGSSEGVLGRIIVSADSITIVSGILSKTPFHQVLMSIFSFHQKNCNPGSF